MKKSFIYALMSAIALTGATILSSCTSSEDTADVNPNYNPETNEVLTQFVFNVSNGSSSSTRQSEINTQASTALPSEKFRGIDDSHILCFIDNTDGDSVRTALTATKDFDMARVANAGTLSNNESRRVLEMSLPMNTNKMVFYGRAIEGDDYNKFGHLEEYNVESDLSKVKFKLSKRLTAAKKSEFLLIQELFASIMTCVMNTSRGTGAVAADATPSAGVSPYGFAIEENEFTTLKWKDYNKKDANGKWISPLDNNKEQKPLEEKLAKAYKEVTSIQDAELRNGSGKALIGTVTDLWSIINAVRCATPTDKAEAVAKYMAHQISLHLAKYFTISALPINGGAVTNVGCNNANDIITQLAADTSWPTEATGLGEDPAITYAKPTAGHFEPIKSLTATYLFEFPTNFNLPEGSTHIKFETAKNAYYYVQDYNSSAAGGGKFTADDYYYPAELLYFGNSALRVSDKEHVVSDYPKSVTLWDDPNQWPSDWSNIRVSPTTRSVAMKNDINYGTSLLKTMVMYNTTSLKDNNKWIQKRDYNITEEDNVITAGESSFKLTGILVGGQWPRVDWCFLPKRTAETGENDYRQGYIYDIDIQKKSTQTAPYIPTSGTTEPTYTMVFDNYNSTGNQDEVFVALEFENNTGSSFFGRDNMIKDGERFYLIGSLNPSGMSIPEANWPKHHAMPPYKDDNSRVTRVFVQDFMTTATFTIGEHSLKYAYLTVPDLRSSSVTLGLSVDVTWSTGLEFTNVILGGETDPHANDY